MEQKLQVERHWWRSMLRLVLFFGLVAPLLGCVLFWGLTLGWGTLMQGVALHDMGFVQKFMATYQMSFKFGALPSALTGWVYFQYLDRKTTSNPNALKRILIGAVLAEVFSLIYGWLLFAGFDVGLVFMLVIAPLTGAMCTWLVFDVFYYSMFRYRTPTRNLRSTWE